MKNSKPYVVTYDLWLVIQKLKNNGYAIPSREYVSSMSVEIGNTLRNIFPVTDIIPAEQIQGFLVKQSEITKYSKITLTGLMTDNVDAKLEFSRSVGLKYQGQGYNFVDLGIHPRNPQSLSLKDQFEHAVQSSPSKGVTLFDDVVFTGGTINDVSKKLNRFDIVVNEVVTSVVLSRAKYLLEQEGVKVIANRIYDDVMDEVCARDFIVGMPDGGRNVIISNNKHFSATYINPVGLCNKWASIPDEHASKFSKSMLEISRDFWNEMNELNNRVFVSSDLEKPPVCWLHAEKTELVNGLDSLIKAKSYQQIFC